MAVNFVEVLDTDGNWHSVNVKAIAHVCWGEIPDTEKRDMVYLIDGSEVALEHKSGSSLLLGQAVGIQDIDDFLDDSEDEEDSEDEIMSVGTETDMPFSDDDEDDSEDDED